MKYLNGIAIFGVGVVGGFVSCGIMVVKSVLKSDSLRAGLSHAISVKVENWIYGDTTYQQRPKITYRDYYNTKRRSYQYYPQSSSKERDTDICIKDEIVFNTREDAETVVDAMKEIIEQYGYVSVADLYDLAGLTSTYKDHQYGWTDISDISVFSHIIKGRDEYLICLPKVIERRKTSE